MAARADALALVLTEMVWPEALSEGLVAGSPSQNIGQRAAIPRGKVAPLIQELTPQQLAAIAAQVVELDNAILAEFASVSARAVEQAWTRAEYVAAIERAAARAGLLNFQGSWASTWYSNLLGSTYNAAIISRFRRQPTVRLFPYLAVETVPDGARRPNHGHMQGFAAAPAWSGWSIASPLYGHGCRCRLRPVTWQQARALGLVGPLPASSSRILAGWSGPDEGWG